MTVSVNSIQAEGLSSLFKNSGRLIGKTGKKKQLLYQEIPVEFWNFFQTLLMQPQLKVEK